MQKLISLILIILLYSSFSKEVTSQNNICIDKSEKILLDNLIGNINKNYSSNNCNLISYGADVANGNLIFSEVDYRWILFEDEFNFHRTLNNFSNTTGQFGNKWSHNYEIYIEYKSENLFHLNKGSNKPQSYRKHKTKDLFISESGYDTLYISNKNNFFIVTEDGNKLEFNKVGYIKKITDSNLNAHHFLYNKNNQLQIIIDPVGRELHVEYNQTGSISVISGPDKKHIKYYYNDKKLLRKVEYPDGSTRSYEYNSSKNITSIKDINTAIYRFKYAKSGKIRSIIDPLEVAEFFDFKNFPSNKCIYTDGENNKWTYFTEKDNIIKVIFPDKRQVKLTYNKKDQLTSYEDINGIKSDYIYINDKLTQIRKSNGNVTTFLHDDTGNLIHYKSEMDEIKYKYNNLNQLVFKDNIQDNLSEKYKRNIWGLISELNIGKEEFKAYYNTNANIYKIKSPQGMEIYKYDVMGNMVSYSDTLNNTFTASFDDMNRITDISFSENVILSFNYDKSGNLIKITGPDKKYNNYKFDKLNRLIEEVNGSNRYIYYDKTGLPIGSSKNEDKKTDLIISGQINQAGIRFSLNRHPLYNISEQIKAGKSIISIPVRNNKRITKNNISDDWVIFFNL